MCNCLNSRPNPWTMEMNIHYTCIQYTHFTSHTYSYSYIHTRTYSTVICTYALWYTVPVYTFLRSGNNFSWTFLSMVKSSILKISLICCWNLRYHLFVVEIEDIVYFFLLKSKNRLIFDEINDIIKIQNLNFSCKRVIILLSTYGPCTYFLSCTVQWRSKYMIYS